VERELNPWRWKKVLISTEFHFQPQLNLNPFLLGIPKDVVRCVTTKTSVDRGFIRRLVREVPTGQQVVEMEDKGPSVYE
jgi:hypothetical protein